MIEDSLVAPSWQVRGQDVASSDTDHPYARRQKAGLEQLIDIAVDTAPAAPVPAVQALATSAERFATGKAVARNRINSRNGDRSILSLRGRHVTPTTPVAGGILARHGARLTRFTIVGGTVFCAGLLVQSVLVIAGVGSIVSYTVQAVYCVELSFALNRRFTWGDRDCGFWRPLVRWNFQKLLMTVPNLGLYALLVRLGVGWLTANIATSALFIPINYITGDLWSFAVTLKRHPPRPRGDVKKSAAVACPDQERLQTPARIGDRDLEPGPTRNPQLMGDHDGLRALPLPVQAAAPPADPTWRVPEYWPSAMASPQPTLVPSARAHRYAPTTHRRASRGPDVRHRLLVVVVMILTTGTLYAIERRLWPTNRVLPGRLEGVWSWLSLLWLAPAIPAACELAGLLIYRQPRWAVTDKPIPQLVCWRIVSRGINVRALTATILRCRAESQALPLFPYVIEVITDTAHDGLPAPADDLRYIRVPRDYQTPKGTRAKARALHYALQVSPLPRHAWIVHLDEESQPTPSGIRGIASMIAEEEANGQLRIGQGTITYHRDLQDRPFFTLADCIRTGSDLGRLFLSMRLGVPLFGLHGSFIVVRNDVEREIGFDVGPHGSITEDAFWGYQQMERGRRCRWVDGYIEEQCTHSAGDFLNQRRRWFSGLMKVTLYAPVKLRWRVMLGISMLAWALAPFAWVYTIEHFVHGGHISPAVQVIANFTLAVYIVTTILGLRVNLTEHGVKSPIRRLGWFITWLTCLPMFSLMESAGVAWALVNPARSFHVVRK